MQEDTRLVYGLYPPVLKLEYALFALAKIDTVADYLYLVALLIPHPEPDGDILVHEPLGLVGLEGLICKIYDGICGVFHHTCRRVVQEEF